MFSSISWSDFIYGILIAVGLYYAVAILFLYRSEILQFLKSHSSNSIFQSDELRPETHDSMIGDATHIDSVNRSSQEESVNAEDMREVPNPGQQEKQ